MDAEDVYFLENSYIVRRQIPKKRRACWVNPILEKRRYLGEFNHLHHELEANPQKFFDYYRMSHKTFLYILNAVESLIIKHSNFRKTILPTERLSLTLRYFATGSSFKTLGYSFRISDVTVGRIVKETSKAIWDILSPRHMSFPSTFTEVESIKQGFWNRWRFPNCVGCIDGKHVRIRNPCHSGSMFRNYKQYFSIVLQGLAGPDYKFIAVDIGGYGKESDGGIFSHSNLSKKLENGALGTKHLAALPGTNIKVPNVILGDEAYPLKNYIMRPFPRENLGPSQKIFNQRLSKARQVIECSFGIISSKWRLLQKDIEVKPDTVDLIVQCICLLHNIVIDLEGEQQTIAMHENIHLKTKDTRVRFSSLGENRSSNSAYTIREKFMLYFCEQEALD